MLRVATDFNEVFACESEFNRNMHTYLTCRYESRSNRTFNEYVTDAICILDLNMKPH